VSGAGLLKELRAEWKEKFDGYVVCAGLFAGGPAKCPLLIVGIDRVKHWENI